jgi:hypothetical protein
LLTREDFSTSESKQNFPAVLKEASPQMMRRIWKQKYKNWETSTTLGRLLTVRVFRKRTDGLLTELEIYIQKELSEQ